MSVWDDAQYNARIPDQSLVVTPGQVNATTVGGDLQQATRSQLGTIGMVYAMNGHSITVRMSRLARTAVRAYWFNPRTGRWYKNGTEYSTGSAAAGNDWVLLLRR